MNMWIKLTKNKDKMVNLDNFDGIEIVKHQNNKSYDIHANENKNIYFELCIYRIRNQNYYSGPDLYKSGNKVDKFVISKADTKLELKPLYNKIIENIEKGTKILTV